MLWCGFCYYSCFSFVCFVCCLFSFFFTKALPFHDTKPLSNWKPLFISMNRKSYPKFNFKLGIFYDYFIFMWSENWQLNTVCTLKIPHILTSANLSDLNVKSNILLWKNSTTSQVMHRLLLYKTSSYWMLTSEHVLGHFVTFRHISLSLFPPLLHIWFSSQYLQSPFCFSINDTLSIIFQINEKNKPYSLQVLFYINISCWSHLSFILLVLRNTVSLTSSSKN